MTEAERLDALIRLGTSLRARIRGFAEELDALPLEPDGTKQAVITWRAVLLALIWDVSEAPLILAKSQSEQIRASRILTRSLLEYGLRLEYYAYQPEEALKDSQNAEAWLSRVVKDGTTAANLANWSKEERRAYNHIIQAKGEVAYRQIRRMLRKVYKRRGYPNKEIKKVVRQFSSFYGISSSLVHGSQGVFWDMLEQPPNPGEPWPLHFRSLRLKQNQVVEETVGFLIQAIRAESAHRRRNLAQDMYAREFDLVTGEWEARQLGAIAADRLR